MTFIPRLAHGLPLLLIGFVAAVPYVDSVLFYFLVGRLSHSDCFHLPSDRSAAGMGPAVTVCCPGPHCRVRTGRGAPVGLKPTRAVEGGKGGERAQRGVRASAGGRPTGELPAGGVGPVEQWAGFVGQSLSEGWVRCGKPLQERGGRLAGCVQGKKCSMWTE